MKMGSKGVAKVGGGVEKKFQVKHDISAFICCLYDVRFFKVIDFCSMNL